MQRISWLIVTYSPLVSACSFFLLVAVKKLKGDCREGNKSTGASHSLSYESIAGSVTSSIFSRASGWHVCLPTTYRRREARRRWRVGMTSQTTRRRNTKTFVLLAGTSWQNLARTRRRSPFSFHRVNRIFRTPPLSARHREIQSPRLHSISHSAVPYACAFNSSYCMKTTATGTSFSFETIVQQGLWYSSYSWLSK